MDVKSDFADRVNEINAYLDLLDAITRAAQSGSPRIGGSIITVQQQRMLYSSVYLQLYNLTEATVTWCLKAITEATSAGGGLTPRDLSEDLLKEWVKTTARTSEPLNANKRLREMIDFCNLLLSGKPLSEWQVAAGGGGNWDDNAIEKIAKRVGAPLKVTPQALSAVKKVVRDDHGALKLVKNLRNKLAHGEISFTECGNDIAPSDLRSLTSDITLYLKEVIDHFFDYVQNQGYLKPSIGGVV